MMGDDVMTILYADDDPEDREIFADVITEINPDIEVFLASDGMEAIQRLHELPAVPDMIFLDVNMPAMSGIECVATLRRLDRFKKATMILYSTTSSELESYKGMKAGADNFLKKANTYTATFDMLKRLVEAAIPCI
ncbi:response regulator [Parachryseolinea silvisoli]|uniref:response regulator n=1 Tax=Parachryseolinea silvisoli TaxID=2873601 RepID=UPI00226585B7|nr:response regulator [Parachryseolinea silvisoli]MCD9015171.1 response regulator [Parachryseolinea silvisoli]